MRKRAIAIILILAMVLSMGNGLIKTEKASAGEKELGNPGSFLLADRNGAASVYVDVENEEISSGQGNDFCGLEIIAGKFAEDVGRVTGNEAGVITDASAMSGNVIIAGTIGGNEVIDNLIAKGLIDVSGLYNGDELKWDCYQMQFVDSDVLAKAGYAGVSNALVITGSNKRGAMYGLFNISEHIGVSAWVYMADAVPARYSAVWLDETLLEFNGDRYLAKEPSVKYRGFFINDEAPSFTGWAGTAFGGVNENCYEHIFELIIRMKANYLWPAMWGNNFSEEGKSFKYANMVLADAYGVCMGTSHHESICRAGVEWQRIYKKYGTSNEWNYDNNSEAIYKFWEDGIGRNGNYESTITVGMRGEGDSALGGSVKQNVDRLKRIITDQHDIINNYIENNPGSKAKDALKIYIPYSENEEFYYGTDDGSIEGLNVWDGMDDVTVVLTDDNYGNLRSIPEEKFRDRKAGWGLYYHLDGHVGPHAYEWVSSTQLERIWDQLTMAYDYNVRELWVVNVGDIKPLEMELNYAMDIAYDMDKWGARNTAEQYRNEWLTKQFGGRGKCPADAAKMAADCFANLLKISTYRKAEFVKSDIYSIDNYNEAQNVLELCESTINKADECYDRYFRDTEWDDAYYQLVYYQAVATANVTRMQIFKGLSDYYAERKSSLANIYAGLVEQCVEYDKELTDYYNNDMTGGKWKKMMSSPHVGFVNWSSDGWKYPEGTNAELPSGSKMLVSVNGDGNIYEEGKINLSVFTNTMKQRYAVTLSNGGTDEYSFKVGTLADWIQITDKNGKQIVNGGTVKDAAYFYVSVDWGRVRSDKTGTVVIKGAGQTVKLNVNTSYTEYKSKGVRTHFESENAVVIDGNEYIENKASANGVKWECMDGCGRYNNAMKMFPVTESFTKRTGDTHTVKVGNNVRTVTEYEDDYNAPYVEYQFYVDEDDDYTFTLYSTTTNNIYKPSGWGYVPVELFYGISVDDGAMQQVNSLPDGRYVSHAMGSDNRWIDGILNNVHISASEEYLTAGLHRVRIYGMHAGLGIERLVISNQDIKKSYLGPQKTFMLDYDIIPEQKNGVMYEAAAGALTYGKPVDLFDMTDMADPNDAADPYEEETPIPSPKKTDTSQTTTNTDKADAGVKDGNNSSTEIRIGNMVINNSVKVKKGTYFTYKKCRYKITGVKKNGGSAELVSPVKKTVKKVTIPKTAKYKGKKYVIKTINKKAFKKCKKLKSITLTKKLYKKNKKLLKKTKAKIKIS